MGGTGLGYLLRCGVDIIALLYNLHRQLRGQMATVLLMHSHGMFADRRIPITVRVRVYPDVYDCRTYLFPELTVVRYVAWCRYFIESGIY